MRRSTVKAVIWGLCVSLYLRYGLQPTGWVFYEASHALGVDWLYWGYSAFRGGGYAFGLWSHQALACTVAGIVVGLLVLRRARKRERI